MDVAEGKMSIFSSQKNLAARVTIPLILLSGYIEGLLGRSLSEFAWGVIFGLPFLVIGLWLLLVPSFVRFDDASSSVVIVHLMKKRVIPYSEIERLEKSVSVFARIILKTGPKFLFIVEDKDRYRLDEFGSSKT